MSDTPQTYFRRGLGLKEEVMPALESEYGSALVRLIRENDYKLEAGRLRLRLAQNFGFCYGVDRAVDYAYQTRTKFPDKTIFLIGEIIHNPFVNRQLSDRDIQFLYPDADGGFDLSPITPDDVVILPAFGVPIEAFETVREIGCVVVDTTCGSVLNVWKRVESYSRDGFTAVVHGKHYHEETRATTSQVRRYPDGKYLVVRDMSETELLCEAIRGDMAPDVFKERFSHRTSAGFDPARDLVRIGVANQTTMLANESLAIAARIGEELVDRYGHGEVDQHFRSFDTICSATQDRQDAIVAMMEEPPDLMVVIGGYNSSNTNHLAYLCAESTRTYHIEDASCIDPARGAISHKVIADERIASEMGWLPAGEVTIGLTAGASTPDSKIGETAVRILETAGYDAAEILNS
jgi:4-hydroxy-3-methylbut-2-enyl diphosphate reductase